MGKRRKIRVERVLWLVPSLVMVAVSMAWSANPDGVDRPANSPAGPDAMERWWADLEKGDDVAARALLQFADHRDESVPFLAERLKPLRLDQDRAQLLLVQLASKDKSVWKPAFEELEYFDPRLAIDLEQLMKQVDKAPARQRLVEILSGRTPGSLEGRQVDLRSFPTEQGKAFNFFSQPGGSWWAERQLVRINSMPRVNTKKKWTRASRAMVLLEHLGTPPAVAVLKNMAMGDPDAQPTRAAKAALERIEKGIAPGALEIVAPDLARVGDAAEWSLVRAEIEPVVDDGRKAARLTPKKTQDEPENHIGIACVMRDNFDEGTIEVDLNGKNVGAEGRIGIAFHFAYGPNYEAVFFRPTEFRKPGEAAQRSVQYIALPDHNVDSLRKEKPGAFEHAVTPAPDPEGWFHVRIEVTDKRVRVFVDGSRTASLDVPRLSERASGSVGFWAENTSATFANLKITPSN